MEDTPESNIPADDSSEDVVTRESLYELAWSMPMTKIGERYGVSSSYLARIYSSLNVPRPPVGYWAQVAAGKGKPRPPLPTALPGTLIAWSRNGTPLKVSQTLPKAPRKLGRQKNKIDVELPRKHPLLLGIEEHFLKVRESENGYLRPTKRSMADLIVSRTGLTHAVDFANQLYLGLMKKGFSVALSNAETYMNRESVDHREKESKRYVHPSLWKPQRPTVVHIGSFQFGLTIYEVSEYVPVKSVGKQYVRLSSLPTSQRRSPFHDGWVMSDDMPTGRLCLQVYSPYYGAEWVRRWIEDKPGDLVSKIAGIIKLLIAEAPVLANKVEVERERREREHQKFLLECEERRRQEEEKRRLKVIQESRDRLESVIQTWAKVNSIRAFFDDIEQSAQRLGDADRKAVLERLTKAKELIGDLNALKHFESWEPPAH
ncbi:MULTISPECIES: hypothetical protein [Pseudomonas]|uniref:Uncharacterized protein n=1 Tax=Pseudomonas umsongensis TaxID=198618 RepID=A0ACC5M8M5_9PSED|nr:MULTISPECIES: hypothetical protein [Pseudomonas]MBB2884971.1 hypothetical protein [Pseudomonas umsongensis]NMN74620.1 hypothetical protein [Pseudomonas sp. KD5]